MRCPKCAANQDKVIDSRESSDGLATRRRRECLRCATRFTTYEQIYREKLRVKKRNGQYEDFDRHKLLGGIEKSCEKLPVTTAQIESLVDNIASQLQGEFAREVPSTVIGERVMHGLRELDEVAYVRFASVYRQFCDADQFIQEIKRLSQKQLQPKKKINGKLPVKRRSPARKS